MHYPKRLIELDLPIARISAHARREKSSRKGQISTLHIWWARRPLVVDPFRGGGSIPLEALRVGADAFASGVGKDDRFWNLADNLTKLYPPGTDERRCVEGALARKKGLGL